MRMQEVKVTANNIRQAAQAPEPVVNPSNTLQPIAPIQPPKALGNDKLEEVLAYIRANTSSPVSEGLTATLKVVVPMFLMNAPAQDICTQLKSVLDNID